MWLTRIEARGVATLPPAQLTALEGITSTKFGHPVPELPVLVDVLTEAGDFPAAAAAAITEAARRARAVHTGDSPFAADRTFARDEAPVVERAVAIGLTLDADWVTPSFGLLADCVTAPDGGRAVLSQAVGYAIARAIMSAPTPEAIAALDTARAATRHAAIGKRFARYVRTARRALAARPEVALRLPTGPAPTKAELTRWLRTLEACWAADARWPADRWSAFAFAPPWPTSPAGSSGRPTVPPSAASPAGSPTPRTAPSRTRWTPISGSGTPRRAPLRTDRPGAHTWSGTGSPNPSPRRTGSGTEPRTPIAGHRRTRCSRRSS